MEMPQEIASVWFDFDWEKRKVWAIGGHAELIERTALQWHFELPFWSTRPPEPLFDLCPMAVLEDLAAHPDHADRIRRADLCYPIDVMEFRGRLCILDGLHRLARHHLERRPLIFVRRHPRSIIPLIVRDSAGGDDRQA